MTPREFHEACHEAVQECPQFRPYDDDQQVIGYGEFGKIPKKGWPTVIRFWKEEPLLWESGYEAALPEEVQEAFNELETVIDKAIKGYFK